MRKRRLPDESVTALITSGPAAMSSSGTRKRRWGAASAGHRVRCRRIRSAERALQALGEPLDLPRGVHDVLRAREERVALVADLDLDGLGGRPDGELVAAPDAADMRLVERGMNLCLHGNGAPMRQAVAGWNSPASMLTRFLVRVSWVKRTLPSAVANRV